jgi:hypothetical protein
MTPLSKHTLRAVTAAIALVLLAAPPAGEAKKGKQPKVPPATVVTGAPTIITGQYAVGTASATCPKGAQAIAGGFAATTPSPDATWVNLFESQRAGTRGWRVSGVQMFGGQAGLTSYAVCQAMKDKLKTRSVSVPLGVVGSTITGLARCPAGTKVLSGGFSVPAANSASSAMVSRSILGNGIGWVVDATRLSGTDAGNMTAYSYCAALGKTATRSSSIAVLGSTGLAQYATTPACPKNTSLRGGGFATSTPVNGSAGSALVFESRPVDLTWRSAAAPGGPAAKSTLVSNSYCR